MEVASGCVAHKAAQRVHRGELSEELGPFKGRKSLREFGCTQAPAVDKQVNQVPSGFDDLLHNLKHRRQDLRENLLNPCPRNSLRGRTGSAEKWPVCSEGE